MMKIKILTLFPDFFNQFLLSSIIGRAISREKVSIELINIRDYSLDKNHRVDDHPIGGGAGLIMRLEPLMDCLKANTSSDTHKIFLSPKGKVYKQEDAIRLSKEEEICLICGHYEGVDSRFEDYVDEEISVGDYIMTGGEIAAMAISDSIIRLLDGVIKEESTKEESFNDGLLEYPQYTYPLEYEGKKIPDILFSGNHEAIKIYHHREALRETFQKRPDLLERYEASKEDQKIISLLKNNEELPLTKKEKRALEKGKRFIPNN